MVSSLRPRQAGDGEGLMATGREGKERGFQSGDLTWCCCCRPDSRQLCAAVGESGKLQGEELLGLAHLILLNSFRFIFFNYTTVF